MTEVGTIQDGARSDDLRARRAGRPAGALLLDALDRLEAEKPRELRLGSQPRRVRRSSEHLELRMHGRCKAAPARAARPRDIGPAPDHARRATRAPRTSLTCPLLRATVAVLHVPGAAHLPLVVDGLGRRAAALARRVHCPGVRPRALRPEAGSGGQDLASRLCSACTCCSACSGSRWGWCRAARGGLAHSDPIDGLW